METAAAVAEILAEAITCARQLHNSREPYAAFVSTDGTYDFFASYGRNREVREVEAGLYLLHPTDEADDQAERARFLARLEALPIGCRIETCNAQDPTESRKSWTRTADGWKHETRERKPEEVSR